MYFSISNIGAFQTSACKWGSSHRCLVERRHKIHGMALDRRSRAIYIYAWKPQN
ncbi:hypothetical protein GIB67_002334 [Kingdonia uniflora]|uniref:Uncharacterized protein n=1 Tax=Kingdonia uniflora TaxID=39325 RepID=A0A7J7KX50_9MAGN|nr:hypothetical protein GIB67_002334 [Kingdonia uniflora]